MNTMDDRHCQRHRLGQDHPDKAAATPLTNSFQEAVAAFEGQDFRRAILGFIGLYQKGCQRTEIMQILDEACWLPNEVEMRENYENNMKLLGSYSFVLGLEPCEFEQLPFRLYMVSDTEFYVFDRKEQRFSELYQLDDGSQIDLHSAPVDAPLFLENEKDYSHLVFLNDNVRKSEDIACDNHIYLYYSVYAELAKLLCVTNLDVLLSGQKFIFMIGAENRIDPSEFQVKFGIDYSNYKRKQPAVDDIKRIIFSWKISSGSGTSFLADILDFHPDLITIPDAFMNYFPKFYSNMLAGKPVTEAISTLRRLPDSDERKTFITRLVHIDSEGEEGKRLRKAHLKELNRVSSDRFLTELEALLSDKAVATAREWLIGIYLAYSYCHGREFSGRIMPVLYVYPHDDMRFLTQVEWESINFYFDLVTEFPYYKAIVIIRDPVTQAGCITKAMVSMQCSVNPFSELAYAALGPRDFYFLTKHPLYQSTRVVRFEDLKLNTDAAFASMAEFLNIPVTESMYHTTWCGIAKLGLGRKDGVAGLTASDGFDPAPVYKAYSDYLSVFDKYRIEMVLPSFMSAYGYAPKYYDGQEFSKQEMSRMMELPFLCESIQTPYSEAERRRAREIGMNMAKLALEIRELASFSVAGMEGEFAPLAWLQPKEELLKGPLYTTRA